MSTTNFITDSVQHAHSEEDSLSSTHDAAVADKAPIDMISVGPAITNPLFGHLSHTFTTRELVQLKCVSRTWTTLLSNNIMITAKARWEDDTKDWYFPLRFQIDPQEATADDHRIQSGGFYSCGVSWIWSGIHHSSGEIHRLPSLPPFLPFFVHLPILTYLPSVLNIVEYHNSYLDCLIASSGGLLLFIDKFQCTQLEGPVVVWQDQGEDRGVGRGVDWRDFRRKGRGKGRGKGQCDSQEATRRVLYEISKSSAPIAKSQNWKPLMVSNPLTKEWRILPAPDCRVVGLPWWNYDGLRAHIVADEKANSYKVIITFGTSLCVYDSSSNRWTCRAFPMPIPWRFCRGSPERDGFIVVPSAIVGGKLYFAELEVDGNAVPLDGYRVTDDFRIRTLGHVQVFEVDERAGTWKPPIRYALRSYFVDAMENPGRDHGFRMGSYAIGMVECMGSMYAIIPARLHVAMTMEDEIMRANDLHNQAPFCRYYDFGYLPLQFYILQLCQGAGLAHGQLLIQVPHSKSTRGSCEHWRRRKTLLANGSGDYLSLNPHKCSFPTNGLSWFRCTARGSVIWVTWADYLLQYDVLSGQSKTRILPDTSFSTQPDVSYRPSFLMKP